MILGTYETYLTAVSALDLSILIPMGIGLIIGGFLFLKLTQYFIREHFSRTYYAIIGFVIGSVFILYPGFEFNFSGIGQIVIFLLCFYIGKMFEKEE